MTMEREKINILISPAGMAAVYHVVALAREHFSSDISIHLCDTNPRHLVAASALATTFTNVLPISDPGHRKQLFDVIKKKSIDVFLPMMEQELCMFPSDDPDLVKLSVRSVSIPHSVIPLFKNKRSMLHFLSAHGIPVPHEMRKNEIRKRGMYFVKPIDGYGSRGALALSGKDIQPYVSKNSFLIEECCKGPEVTIETFNTKILFSTICRERIETKGGVCTKARVYFDPELESLAKRVCALISLPPALCIQVMKNSKKKWVVTDINPRLGAGTSMATAYGWSLGSALLAHLFDRDPSRWLTKRKGDVYIVRTYQDMVMSK